MPNHFIAVSDAASLISTFGTQKESMLVNSFQNNGTLPVCETFDRGAIDTILAETGCTGLRIYLGMDENDKVKLILVGVNSSDEDMILDGNTLGEFDGDCVVENGTRCPTTCPPSSVLNS